MAVSSSSGHDRRDASRTLVRDFLPSDRYGLILVAIPLLYSLALVGHVAFSLSAYATMVPTSVVGALLLIDAMFVHPPTAICGQEPGSRTSQDSGPETGLE